MAEQPFVSNEDVAKAAGHASPQVTMSMYAHAMTGSARRVADTVNRLVPVYPDDMADDTALQSSLLALRSGTKALDDHPLFPDLARRLRNPAGLSRAPPSKGINRQPAGADWMTEIGAL